MRTGVNIAQDVLGWMRVVLMLAGFAAVWYYQRCSSWTLMLMGGFGIQTLVYTFYRVAPQYVESSRMPWKLMDNVYILASLGGIAGSCMVVVGVAGLLRDTRRGDA